MGARSGFGDLTLSSSPNAFLSLFAKLGLFAREAENETRPPVEGFRVVG